MPMPETAVHEDDRSVFWERQVGPARQIGPMQPKA
jgi:hypothetical protein